MEKLTLILKNKLNELKETFNVIDGFCKQHSLPQKFAYDLNLVLEELLTNTILYGYKDGGDHDIHVHMELNTNRLHLQVIDDAQAFNPLNQPDPDFSIPYEDRPIGGLGVYLVRYLMDEIKYERQHNQNIITMQKVVSE